MLRQAACDGPLLQAPARPVSRQAVFVTGLTAGTVTVRYTVTSGFSCVTTVTQALTVNPLPVVAAIAGGAANVCVGSATAAFTDATAGGVWSIAAGTGTASITAGGVSQD